MPVRNLTILIITTVFFLTAAYTAVGQTSRRPAVRQVSPADILFAKGKELAEKETQESLQAARQALAESAQLYDTSKEARKAAAARSLEGSVSENLSDCEHAIKAYSRAIELQKGLRLTFELSVTHRSLARCYTQVGKYAAALEEYKASLIYKRQLPVRDRAGEAQTNVEMALLYSVLGNHVDAAKLADDALHAKLVLYQRTNDATVAHNIGLIFRNIGDAVTNGDARQILRRAGIATFDSMEEVALAYFASALKVRLANGDNRGAAQTLTAVADIFSSNHLAGRPTRGTSREELAGLLGLAEFDGGFKLYSDALERSKVLGDAGNQAYIYLRLGQLKDRSPHLRSRSTGGKSDPETALDLYYRALFYARKAGTRRVEAMALSHLMHSHASEPHLAVLFGKEAVNIFQDLRRTVAPLNDSTRKSYDKLLEPTYRELADLLISLGRLPMAQAVLAMLKDEEVFGYLRRDASEAEKLRTRIDLRDDEQKALKRFEELFGRIGAMGAEFDRLQTAKKKLPAGTALPSADQARLATLEKDLEDANKAFQVFTRQLAEEFATRPSVPSDIRENRGLQADLKSWGTDVVSLYTIVGDDRYRVVVTTPRIQTDGKYEIKAAELNKKIAEFRLAVQSPGVDPRPLGKELYDIIVKPIENHLRGAEAGTLLWSLDGALRYLPIAALWDGEAYFGQKYRNVVITLASRTRLSEEPKADWRMLGLGVTGEHRIAKPDGLGQIDFAALPGVESELKEIIKDERKPGDEGIFLGKPLMGPEFTKEHLKDNLESGYSAVHMASHFALLPGDITQSFLLLGDGTPLTVDELRNSPRLQFTGVELMTLSACDTAVGEAEANGKEIESFAVVAQQNGAKAVLATLWKVADESTSLFMTEFYRIKKANPTMSKAEAIRQAQKAMIEGRIKASGTSTACRGDRLTLGTKKEEFKCDPNAPYSHPNFWSPFVLIGNWR